MASSGFTYPTRYENNMKSRSCRYNDQPYKSLNNYIGKPFYNLGEKGSGVKTQGPVQDFNQLRQKCLSGGYLFEDPEFPASDSSLYYSKRPDRRYIEWKRPMEIVKNPEMFVDKCSRFDVQQGELGDCWLLAAIANLTMHQNLFSKVVPGDQDFKKNYAGIFHFRFWQYGRWLDVVIDDRLPTYHGELIYLHSEKKNEFWSALLEKACAKLHGSYEALKGGTTCEAMEDFTGGVAEMYRMDEAPSNLYSILLKAYERNSMMGCGIASDPKVPEAVTPQGLIRCHAYSITCVKYVDIATPNQSGKIPLLRLRNPWGNGVEWNGPWSDSSPEWKLISVHEKKELGHKIDNDGEFWMSFQDFKKYFTHLEICNLSPDSLTEDDLTAGKKRWEMSVFEGEWVRGVTAGGCRNSLKTFWHNPQYRITLVSPDEGDDKCTVLCALMQKSRRAQNKMRADYLSIGFVIYRLNYPNVLPKPLDLNYFEYNKIEAKIPDFINRREVSCRFKLSPGTYCIVPSTYKPNEEGEFLLRIFSENKNNMEENDDNVGVGEIDDRVRGQSKLTCIAEKLQKCFRDIAGDDMEVDWQDLKAILDHAMKEEMPSEGFSKDICRSMLAMMDTDHSGKLDIQEFITLWYNIKSWRAVFKLYEKDGSGCLSAFELRQALNSAGYRLNNHILNILVHRYGTEDGLIPFDDFIMCAVRLKTMIDTFNEYDHNHCNSASFTLDEWLRITLYS